MIMKGYFMKSSIALTQSVPSQDFGTVNFTVTFLFCSLSGNLCRFNSWFSCYKACLYRYFLNFRPLTQYFFILIHPDIYSHVHQYTSSFRYSF